MSRHFITGRDELLLPWAARQIEHIGTRENFGPAASLGIATGPGKQDRLLAVVVYHFDVPKHDTVMISVAAASPMWCTRGTIRTILRIPFYQYNRNRVWLAVPHTASRTVKLAERLGFTREGVLREHFGPSPKTHCVVLGMLKREFINIYEKRHGQERPQSASAS